MQIGPGHTLAHYEIVSLLGKGGMGEVYRASDSKLGRDVAIKVLPQEFTTDAERLARFEREARVLASLDHPWIASIFGIEEVDGLRFLVMQLAEGENLADRLRRGPIPIDEALPIARQIAEGLDVAHERGIVHRDLKPANVMVDREGNVKILDFGLAKAFETEEGDGDFSNSPTMVRAASHAGVILGTAAYMSPEQARGKRVDKRADIWAFGVLLREMLTGERLFEGETVSDTLAAVLTKDIDLSSLPKTVPASVHWVLERCLERDPRKRLRDIGEARLSLQNAIDGHDSRSISSPAAPRRTWRELLAWALVGLLLIAVIAVGWTARNPRATPRQELTARLSLFDEEDLAQDGGSSAVISADGTMLALVAGNAEGSQLYLKRLDQLGAVLVPGTRGASSPFFSPDGQWLGFFADGKLKKVATTGGAPVSLCDAALPRGGSWGEGGNIVFAPGVATGLWIISENGGAPEPLTTTDVAAGERSHRWPGFVPGGEAVLFMAQGRGGNYEDGTIQVVTLSERKPRIVHAGGAYPRYAESGHLLFGRQGTLFAAPFDRSRLETTAHAKPVLQQILSRTVNEATDDGTVHYDVSRNGILVYRQGTITSNSSRMVIVDRENNLIAASPSAIHTAPSLSFDGTRVAVSVSNQSRSDIWIWDVASGSMSRLTFDGSANAISIWSPDGSQVAYSSVREAEGGTNVSPFVKAADGASAERPLAPDAENAQILGNSGWLTSWSPDGRYVVFQSDPTGASFDVSVLPIHEPAAPRALFTGRNAEVSPDGKWIAYESTENDRDQVFIRSVDGGGGRFQISRDRGQFPHWTKEGREIVYVNPGQGFKAVPVNERGSSLVVGEEVTLFDGRYLSQDPLPAWDVSADGSRFVFLESPESSDTDSKTVIVATNWHDELRRLAPTD
jgi:Tol biopolymer transport system component